MDGSYMLRQVQPVEFTTSMNQECFGVATGNTMAEIDDGFCARLRLALLNGVEQGSPEGTVDCQVVGPACECHALAPLTTDDSGTYAVSGAQLVLSQDVTPIDFACPEPGVLQVVRRRDDVTLTATLTPDPNGEN
jgi:hypothetical protein